MVNYDVKNKGFNTAINLVITIIVIMWIIEIFNFSIGHQLSNYGIIPRTITGLSGIIFCPFLHGSFNHLILNTIPFIILGLFIAVRGVDIFIKTSLFIILTGGIGVWIFARPSSHIGASGLVFGYFGYLVARGIYSKSFSALFVSLIIIFLYGSLIWGVFPTNPYIS